MPGIEYIDRIFCTSSADVFNIISRSSVDPSTLISLELTMPRNPNKASMSAIFNVRVSCLRAILKACSSRTEVDGVVGKKEGLFANSFIVSSGLVMKFASKRGLSSLVAAVDLKIEGNAECCAMRQTALNELQNGA